MWTETLARLRAYRREKIVWGAALLVFFCVPYFLLQRVAFLPVGTFTPTAIDRAVPFQPEWAWIYQSGYLLLALVPWLIDSREVLVRYARAFIAVSLAGFLVFALLPVAAPRPSSALADGMYGLLVSYDGPTNTFPSLHVALITLTVLVARRESHGRRPALVALTVVWAALVCYSTLATKQHYAVDLPAGAALGWLMFRWLA